ncbi:precorrin-3B C(17)-methyltransferase [Cohnella xylanilytica]|uniref:Precorrin-3B C(17)-methyltransferase n=1 Tax=Cohnella xylanilytica TaxID=557555 RepID=A0A841TXT4_9BACL|nr:precorrin-3B C(17)-methyltransferase [Cohnella xylanilytica]MBB6692409.1 precorrin-3B C(17)-methyltransferase [Cohnella xylanilytica]
MGERGKLLIVGFGPGSHEHLTKRARDAIAESEVVIGYNTYVDLIRDLLTPRHEIVRTGMTEEVSRAREAVRQAESGKRVAVISSGDAGVYGMAGLVYEVLMGKGWTREAGVEVEVVPGISAIQSVASLLGAPVMHDACTISLSDHLTPWETIVRRVEAAAKADFVIALYNPRSGRRTRQIVETRRILLEHRSPDTPVGIVKSAYRDRETVVVTTLADMLGYDIGMLTTVIIGNSSTTVYDGLMITPRGYQRKYTLDSDVQRLRPHERLRTEAEPWSMEAMAPVDAPPGTGGRGVGEGDAWMARARASTSARAGERDASEDDTPHSLAMEALALVDGRASREGAVAVAQGTAGLGAVAQGNVGLGAIVQGSVGQGAIMERSVGLGANMQGTVGQGSIGQAAAGPVPAGQAFVGQAVADAPAAPRPAFRQEAILEFAVSPGVANKKFTARQMAALGELVGERGEIEYTPHHQLIVRIRADEPEAIARKLAEEGFLLSPIGDVAQVKACDFCNLEKAESIPYAEEIHARVGNLAMPKELKIGFNGCGMACYGAVKEDIGLVYRRGKFDLFLGAKTVGRNAHAGIPVAEGVPPEEIAGLVERIVLRYQREGHPNERFHKFFKRVGTIEGYAYREPAKIEIEAAACGD